MNKNVVYSSVFGKYDKFPYIDKFEDSVDYILFTPEKIKPQGSWKVINVCREFKDDSKNSRIYKLLPHLFLSEYDNSCWIDADLKIDFNILDVFKTYKKFLCFEHPNNVVSYQQEAGRCVKMRKESEDKLNRQVTFYDKHNIENKFRRILAGFFIVRRHNDIDVKQFDIEWFSHVAAMGKRDQVSLGYLRNLYFPFFNIEKLNCSDFNIKKIGHRLRG